MDIKIIKENKKKFIELLLLADEQESMIDKYLDRGDMFALYDGDLKSTCVVTYEGNNTYEIKNIATYDRYQNKGYGKYLINYIFNYYKDRGDIMMVGTGDSDLTVPFYKSCGFEVSHYIKDFFIDNYDKPIFENGKQLIDMVYLKRYK